MKYVGTDLHKNTITICVLEKVRGQRKVKARRTLGGKDTEGIQEFFQGLLSPVAAGTKMFSATRLTAFLGRRRRTSPCPIAGCDLRR